MVGECQSGSFYGAPGMWKSVPNDAFDSNQIKNSIRVARSKYGYVV